jgi:Family of unknown function (DUF6455)
MGKRAIKKVAQAHSCDVPTPGKSNWGSGNPMGRRSDTLALEDTNLTEVMSRIRFDLATLFNSHAFPLFEGAMVTCFACQQKTSCDQWISSTPEGDGADAPSFCPVAPFLLVFGVQC